MPLRWTVETSRATPAQFEAYQGETLALEAALQSYGKPLEASGIAALFWQTNGMGSAYWETTAAVNSNRLSAVWTPEMDVGAKSYNCFIGVPGTVYHAAFQLRLRPSPGADPNTLPLPVPVIDFAKVRVLNPPWGGGGSDGAARPLPPYLHALDFDDSYPEAAAEYYAQRGSGLPTAACSAVRDGNFLSRNFDYPFDDRAEFVVKMSAGPNRFASVGVAQVGTNLTESFVTSGKPSRWYKALPGATVDGINENGVVAEINVVGGAPEWGSDLPIASPLHPLAAVRWALDHATNALDAATYLAANIRFPEGWTQNFHYMIADETATYVVENGAFSNVTGRAVLTNFKFLPSPTYGAGWERYQLLSNPSASITNAWFTRCYERSTNPPWLSEFGNNYEYWNAALNAWELKPKEAHRGEIVNGESWWQSVHTSVYDITNRVLRVAVQEVDDWYVFQVPAAGGCGTDEAKVREIAGEVVAPVASSVSSLSSSVAGLQSSKLDLSGGEMTMPMYQGHKLKFIGGTGGANEGVAIVNTNGYIVALLGIDSGRPCVRASEVYGDTVYAQTFSAGGGYTTLEPGKITQAGNDIELPSKAGTMALLDDITDPYVPTAADPTFSNAVLAVGLNIDTNAVAVLNEIAENFGDFPIEGTATTVGGLLAALAAAVAWLKKNKAGKSDIPYKLATGAASDRSVKVYDATSAGVTVTLPAGVPVGVTDFEVWIRMGATVQTVTYSPDAIQWKDGKVPTSSDYTANATNIVHFTIVKESASAEAIITAILAGFKAATPAA